MADDGKDEEDGDDAEDIAEEAGQNFGGPRLLRQRSRAKWIDAKTRPSGDEHVPAHQRPREQDEETKAMMLQSIKQDRFCCFLEDTSIQGILASMKYYVFSNDDVIVRQGDPGRFFFIIQEGSCKVFVKGQEMATMEPKGCFGAIALLYNCPRTATVKAVGTVGVWGADGDSFRSILQDSARRHYEENLRFLDYVSWFAALTHQQKDRIVKFALSVRAFEDGATIINQGDPPSAVYIVKKGEVSILVDGKKVTSMRTGDTFGERAILYGTAASATVITDGPCEFVCLGGVKQMQDALGENLVACLEGPFIMVVLRSLPLLSHFSVAQLYQFQQAMEIADYEPGTGPPVGLQLMIVINGSISGTSKGQQITVKRGQYLQDESMAELENHICNPARKSITSPRQEIMTSGAKGARVATITREGFSKVLKDLGFLRLSEDEETGDALRKKLITGHVQILRDIPQEKADMLVERMVLRKYSHGAEVIKQGDIGSTFFIVKSGEIQILRDGLPVKQLGPNSSFGERALLLDEVRSATAQVSSDVAHLWHIDKDTFANILSDSLRKLLTHKIQMQDTTVKLRSLEHIRLIGCGNFGSVRMVQHRWTKTRYALKRVLKENGLLPQELKDEVTLLQCVEHPFVLGIVRMFDTPKSVYILTELITGGQLYDQLGRMGILTKKQAQFYAGTLVIVLEALHDLRIVYRDLKPENVMLDSTGYLKLIDFGLAKRLDKALPKTYSVVGTPAYMAPEVITSAGHGYPCDLWSLGVMIYEFVVGNLPFGMDGDVQDVIAAILEDDLKFPPKYNDSAGKRLLFGMLTKDPTERLGCGADGWQVIKEHKFFKQGVSGNLFNKLVSHEMEPPVVPEEEQYTEDLDEEVSLSDAHELYCED